MPVGCVLVDVSTGEVVCRATNRPNEAYNATAHAEMVAIDHLMRTLPSRAEARSLLQRCNLYVTVEPCVMCAAALARVGIRKVVYGAHNDKFGGCGTATDVASDRYFEPSARHTPFPCSGGVLRDEAVALLRRFYARTNVRAPNPKRG